MEKESENMPELTEKAKPLAPHLAAIAKINTKYLFKELRENKQIKVDDSKFEEIFEEMLFFYLHFIDRNVFLLLGAEKRDVYMDAVVLEIINGVFRANKMDTQELTEFITYFKTKYNKRQIEYWKFEELFSMSRAIGVNTVFWEFSKKIARIFGSETDEEINSMSLLVLTSILTYSPVALKYSGLFSKEGA